MKRIPAIKALMTPFPYSIAAHAPLAEAQQFMHTKQIRHLPVTRDGDLTGMITDRDIKLVLGPDFAYPDVGELTVDEVMMADAYSVDLNERADDVLAHMAEHHLGSALVTRKGKLVGIFTVTDACRAFAAHLREPFQAGGDGGLVA
jgi:acetoin utilization protein AcuB